MAPGCVHLQSSIDSEYDKLLTRSFSLEKLSIKDKKLLLQKNIAIKDQTTYHHEYALFQVVFPWGPFSVLGPQQVI